SWPRSMISASEVAYSHKPPASAAAAVADRRLRLRAGALSLGLAIAIFAAKFIAYRLTNSTAILSDALESVVNIVAATFTLASLAIASRPADESHPYGHGKVEFLSSGFEGGLIAFAALLIVYQAAEALWLGRELAALDVGLALVIAAGIANALLGYFLVRVGRRSHSPAIEADGLHVLSDFWTSFAVVVALGLVWVSGWQILDPLVAIAVGTNLALVGARLLRGAVGGLLDESDPVLLSKVAAAMHAARRPGIIAVHRLRAIRSGGTAHVDAHLVVPRFWSVSQAHETANRFEEDVRQQVAQNIDFIFHIDPCREVYCQGCQVEPCPVRGHEFAEDRHWSLPALTAEPPADSI
ncbi:MAG: cation diffusion facilitator family transporter, partial [Candidatus Binatia bacterium]